MTTIPLGIYSNSKEEVAVRFDHVEQFEGLSLYDALLDETIAIEEDVTLMLPGNTNGRYLLTFASTMAEDLLESITISSVERGQIWVTSDINDPLEEIMVFDVNGQKWRHLVGINNSSETIAIESGIYIVQARTVSATQTAKVMERDRKSTRLNYSHEISYRMPSSA